MKVKDERDCCHTIKDLLPYRGEWGAGEERWYQQKRLRFCKHCGQLWGVDSVPSGAGDSDTVLVRCYPGVLAKP